MSYEQFEPASIMPSTILTYKLGLLTIRALHLCGPSWLHFNCIAFFFTPVLRVSLLYKKHSMIKNMWKIKTRVHLMTTYNQNKTNLFWVVKLWKVQYKHNCKFYMQGQNNLFHWIFKFSTSNKEGKETPTSFELKLRDPMLSYKSCNTLFSPMLHKTLLIRTTQRSQNSSYKILVVRTFSYIKLV
jgi:hypothetical protein